MKKLLFLLVSLSLFAFSVCAQYTSPSGISGAGTANTIPKWTGTSSQGASTMTDNGTTVSFATAPTFTTVTAGSIPFAGTGGLLSQNNTNLFWSNINTSLGIGTNSPRRRIDSLNATAPQLRLTHTDNSIYTDFQTTSGGILNITTSGRTAAFPSAGGAFYDSSVIVGDIGSISQVSSGGFTYFGNNVRASSAAFNTLVGINGGLGGGSAIEMGYTGEIIFHATSSGVTAGGTFATNTTRAYERMRINSSGSLQMAASGDIIITSATKGLIQCDSAGVAWRRTVNTSGADVKTSLGTQSYCQP